MADQVPQITPPDADEWPEPTPEQLDLVRRVLAPHIHRARVEHAERQSAA
ncbi:hypothetical protein [Streptomyces sp. MZ04]|nr:hypothetical protein [Streptomyces sp. MZ04]